MLKKFEGEKKKQYIALAIAGIVLGGGVLLFSTVFSGSGNQQQQAQTQPAVKVEGLEADTRKIEEESFRKIYGEELLKLQERVRALETEKERQSPPTPPLSPPPPPPPLTQTPSPQAPAPPPPPPTPPPPPPTPSPPPPAPASQAQLLTDLIGMVGSDTKPQNQNQAQGQEVKPSPSKDKAKEGRIPAGSFVKGVLLSGLDAPTGGRAQSSPHPVLIRVVDKAILPNLYKSDIKDCFVIGSGYGDLSAERAYIRLEVLSCVKKNGEVIERKVQGYVAGEDGKVGLAGRVVSKQGQVLARMLLAGFIDGISRVFQQGGTTVIVSPQGALTTVNPQQALQTGITGGISTAARELVEFYKKLAEETYPVVEINAGRNIDLVFLQSISLSEDSQNNNNTNNTQER